LLATTLPKSVDFIKRKQTFPWIGVAFGKQLSISSKIQRRIAPYLKHLPGRSQTRH
jgi:hypothetical protein